MKLIRLNPVQMTAVYLCRMTRDFPRNERKPLWLILQGMKHGTYEILGLLEGRNLLGYAIFVRHEDNYLFDYLAIENSARDKGVGTAFLKRIERHYRDAACIFGEVENPDLADTEETKALQERRRAFYLRNGYVDTSVCVNLFGVDYKVLEIAGNERAAHTPDEIRTIYENHYRAMLPDGWYDDHVIL